MNNSLMAAHARLVIRGAGSLLLPSRVASRSKLASSSSFARQVTLLSGGDLHIFKGGSGVCRKEASTAPDKVGRNESLLSQANNRI